MSFSVRPLERDALAALLSERDLDFLGFTCVCALSSTISVRLDFVYSGSLQRV